MYKGTTPTYTFIAPESVDLTDATKIWVTFSTMDEKELFSKESGEIVLADAQTIEVYLTQEETLKFPTGSVKAQINWIYLEETKTKRACSEKMIIKANTNLKDVVLNE